jgi:Fic family protein
MLLLNFLVGNPYTTVKRAAQQLGVAFTTAQRAINKLVDLSMLIEVSGAKRDRVYCAKDILDILEEPANLVPRTA